MNRPDHSQTRPQRRPQRHPLALMLLLLAGAGCGEAPPAVGSGSGSASAGVAAAGETLEVTSSRGTFVARITPSSEPIPLNEPFEALVELVDPTSGERFTDYDAVTIDARMPAHRHGMLRDVALEPTGDGRLRASGLLFHMVGHWEIHVDVSRGAHIERAQASVDLAF